MKLMTVEMTHEDGVDLATWSTTGEVPPAEAFDRLISVLAESRKMMEPAFSERLPLLIKTSPQVDGPAWQWAIEPDGALILNLRHPGLGWLGFRMPRVDAFREDLSSVLEQRNALRDEFDERSSTRKDG
ncbi:hypothetical protein [Variovorax sp. OK605]|uniref:hypothetical protein n=1 Tax=Variovorax sp. OK605 TaxID=1855317 RepID=UPI000B89F849|nr:hypothetical protein [Variovorax sp. OK605]